MHISMCLNAYQYRYCITSRSNATYSRSNSNCIKKNNCNSTTKSKIPRTTIVNKNQIFSTKFPDGYTLPTLLFTSITISRSKNDKKKILRRILYLSSDFYHFYPPPITETFPYVYSPFTKVNIHQNITFSKQWIGSILHQMKRI